MTLVRKLSLLALLVLLPPMVVVSVFNTWAGQQQIEELTDHNLSLELTRFQEFCEHEYQILQTLGIQDTEFYRENAQKRCIDWAAHNAPLGGRLRIVNHEGSNLLQVDPGMTVLLFREAIFPPWQWTIRAEVGSETIYALARQNSWATVLVAVLCAIPVLVGAFLFSLGISRNVEHLQKAVEAMADGQLQVRAHAAGTLELVRLSQAFNAMAENLENLTGSLEHQVRDRTTLLEKSLEDFRKAQDEIIRREKLASLGFMVAGLAHEINTPLGICVTSSSMLSDRFREVNKIYAAGGLTKGSMDSFMAVMAEGLHLLDFNLQRAADLVRSFKSLAVDDMGDHSRVFDVRAYTQDIHNSLSHELTKKNITCTIRIDEPAMVKGHPGLLYQILLNLIMNSILHGFFDRASGDIEIVIQFFPTEFHIEFKDNGQGMTNEIEKRLFEPFFTTQPGRGSGLGMTLVYNIVATRLGGNIHCTTVPGEGTRFQIAIPWNKGDFEPI